MLNHRPTGWLVILGDERGEAEPGTELMARTNSVQDADGIGDVSFQWMRGGAEITGATDQTYTVTDADQGAVLFVKMLYTDGNGNRETVASRDRVTVPDPISRAVAAMYTLVMERDKDKAGAAFYEGHYRNGVPLSTLVKDMEDNKARGAK